MKIDINKLKEIPHGISSQFGLCQYGKALSPDVKDWADFHGLKYEQSGPCINVYIDKDPSDLFLSREKFAHMDGFSPNLNKHLHVGHLSNLILAKAFQSMGITEGTVAILGDTLNGDVSKDDAYSKFNWYCKTFGYDVDMITFASNMKASPEGLVDGVGEYAGTKVFDVDGDKIVGIKSDGSTTYFYQDAAFASMLWALQPGRVLYLTGSEQTQHFNALAKLYPNIHHIALGLVTTQAGKMSSRIGNVITAEDVINGLYAEFGDYNVVYNVLAGFFLKSSPSSPKKIDMDYLSNRKNSQGLYISYQLARLKSAGLICDPGELREPKLKYKLHKAQYNLNPSVLFEGVFELAEKISVLYDKHRIKDNPENAAMFETLGSDLASGMKLLGLLEVDRV